MAATSNCQDFACCGCCAVEMPAERAPIAAITTAKLATATFLIVFTREFYIAPSKHMGRTSCNVIFGNSDFRPRVVSQNLVSRALILGRPLDMVDDEYWHGDLIGLQFEAELLLDRG